MFCARSSSARVRAHEVSADERSGLSLRGSLASSFLRLQPQLYKPADQISLRCLTIFLNGILSVFALRRTAKVVRFRASAIVSTLFALRTSARSLLSCSGVQGARGVPFISPSPFVPLELQPASSRIRLAYRLAVDRRDYSSHTTSAFHPVPVYR